MNPLTIQQVTPQAGVRGGHISVYCTGIAPQDLETCRIVFGSSPTRPILVTPTFLCGTVPENVSSDTITIVQNGRHSNPVLFTVATVLAENLHPVTSPAIDCQGAIYTTISGTKGQHVPVSIFKITPWGKVEPFTSGIVNPTGLAFGPDGVLYVSSRHEGRLYRVNSEGIVSPFAEGLGIATGIAVDPRGCLYVGDRRGAIYRVSELGEVQPFAKLPPSMTAYHLTYGGNSRLYVSYPTLSGDDRLYCIEPNGEVQVVVRGLGGAQGLAVDAEHNLYVVAYLEGRGGVVQITPAGKMRQVISGINLVGLAFGLDGELFLTDNSTLYKLILNHSDS